MAASVATNGNWIIATGAPQDVLDYMASQNIPIAGTICGFSISSTGDIAVIICMH